MRVVSSVGVGRWWAARQLGTGRLRRTEIGSSGALCAGQDRGRPVNPSRKLQRFESSTRHQVQTRPLTSRDADQGPSSFVRSSAAVVQPSTTGCGAMSWAGSLRAMVHLRAAAVDLRRLGSGDASRHPPRAPPRVGVVQHDLAAGRRRSVGVTPPPPSWRSYRNSCATSRQPDDVSVELVGGSWARHDHSSPNGRSRLPGGAAVAARGSAELHQAVAGHVADARRRARSGAGRSSPRWCGSSRWPGRRSAAPRMARHGPRPPSGASPGEIPCSGWAHRVGPPKCRHTAVPPSPSMPTHLRRSDSR